MGYDSRGSHVHNDPEVRAPGTGALIERTQAFEHRGDTTVSKATHAGVTPGPAGGRLVFGHATYQEAMRLRNAVSPVVPPTVIVG